MLLFRVLGLRGFKVYRAGLINQRFPGFVLELLSFPPRGPRLIRGLDPPSRLKVVEL